MVSNSFNAQNWMDSITKIFQSQADTPKGQDPFLVRNMRISKLSWAQIEPMIPKALAEAKNFALLTLKESDEKQANKSNS